eukprot:275789_1
MTYNGFGVLSLSYFFFFFIFLIFFTCAKDGQSWISPHFYLCWINFIFLCIQNVCFTIFSFQIYEVNYIGIACTIFTSFGLVTMVIFYVAFNSFLLNVCSKKTRKDIQLFGYYASDYHWFHFLFNIAYDMFVNIPMTILFLYYMYNNNLVISWYFSFIINILYGIYQNIWYLREGHQFDNDWTKCWGQKGILLVTKYGIVAFVFGIVYFLCVDTDLNIEVTIVLLSIGSCIFAALVCFACGIVYLHYAMSGMGGY